MIKQIIFILLFLIASLFQYKVLGNCTISTGVIGNIIVFLSIIFGFYITSLSIFVTSRYVSSLYKIADKNNKSVTLLHTLLHNFKTGLVIALVSIFYLLIIQVSIEQIKTGVVPLNDFRVIPLLGLTIYNFIYSYMMLSDLIRIIIQEAKEKPE